MEGNGGPFFAPGGKAVFTMDQRRKVKPTQRLLTEMTNGRMANIASCYFLLINPRLSSTDKIEVGHSPADRLTST